MKKILFIISFLFCFSAIAQVDDPGDNPDVAVPIDGGVSALVIAGAAYGFKKYKEQKKSNNPK